VSAVETPPAPETTPEQRTCPRCGAALTPEQEWCLECGADVGATVAGPPSWRGPVALVAVLLAVAAVALILALVELAGDPEQVSEQPAAAPTATAPPVTAPTPAPTTTPPPAESTTVPPSGDTGGTSDIAEWPAGTEGWTVVLESSATETAAETRARELAEQGVPVGLLNSDDYGSLEPGRFVVFSGQYDSRRAADDALGSLSSQVEGAYVRRVAPE
jgi:septal ring-binding cell division protein DamX